LLRFDRPDRDLAKRGGGVLVGIDSGHFRGHPDPVGNGTILA
jgi:hypothetical protein